MLEMQLRSMIGFVGVEFQHISTCRARLAMVLLFQLPMLSYDSAPLFSATIVHQFSYNGASSAYLPPASVTEYLLPSTFLMYIWPILSIDQSTHESSFPDLILS